MAGVWCTVFAPPSVARADPLLVQVFVHSDAQRSKVENKAQKASVRAEWRGAAPLSKKVDLGDRFTLELDMGGPTPVALGPLAWDGNPVPAQFRVVAPSGQGPGIAVGVVNVTTEAGELGQVGFEVQLLAPKERAQDWLDRHKFAFFSYAEEDSGRLDSFHDALEQKGIEVFMAKRSLSPGDFWKRELYRAIDSCDLFCLFWSDDAKASRWVRRETRYALARCCARGKQALSRTECAIRVLFPIGRKGGHPPKIVPVALDPVSEDGLPWRETKGIHFDTVLT